MEEQAREKRIINTHSENEINEQFNFTNGSSGLHQQNYHNQAKIYQ